MIYFYVGQYQNKRVELSASGGYAAIGVHYDGRAVGSLGKDETRQLFQWLVNHNGIDIEEVAEYKRVFDETQCTCNKEGVLFSRSKPSCPKHFEVG